MLDSALSKVLGYQPSDIYDISAAVGADFCTLGYYSHDCWSAVLLVRLRSRHKARGSRRKVVYCLRAILVPGAAPLLDSHVYDFPLTFYC